MSFLYFIIMIGALVFFHEFGHFIVAKAFDVKVLRFSIGFGPKILGFEYGETEYVVCALPLGGYVQMLGHDFGDLETVDEEEMARALMAKPIWQRSLVILAGPVANIILPVVIYFIVGMTATQMPPSLIGEVFDDTPAATAGLQPGDKIVAIAGREARYWHDITDAVVDAPGVPLTFTYERDGKRHDVDITPETKTSTDFLGLDMRTYGQIGIHLGAYGPTIAIAGPDTPAEAGGLEPFDRVVSVNGEPVERYDELASKIRASKGAALDLVVMRPRSIGVDYGELWRFDVAHARVQPVEDGGAWSIGVVRAQMVISEVLEASAAAKAGLEVGDRIVSL
ncbi:MAG: RIP metalloprotease RseP, partial [Myxococcota bacterium]